MTKPKEPASLEIGYYATSLALDEYTDEEIQKIIRDHWSAIENGTHYRRDVTLGEDANTTMGKKAVGALASFRNLAIGVYELQRERKKTKADTLKSWCQQQTFTMIWRILKQ